MQELLILFYSEILVEAFLVVLGFFNVDCSTVDMPVCWVVAQ